MSIGFAVLLGLCTQPADAEEDDRGIATRSGGGNLYPAEIENALMSHPEIADVAGIGVSSEKRGEAVKAIVVDAAGDTVSDPELIAYCPSSIDRTDALPRNPSGKILKAVLREPYRKGKRRRVTGTRFPPPLRRKRELNREGNSRAH